MDIKCSESYYVRKLLLETKIKMIMTMKVVSIGEGEPFNHVEEKFKIHRIRHLPVVDKDNKVEGVISQRDLYKIQSPRKLEDGTWYYDSEMLDQFILNRVMNKEVLVLNPENSVADAVLKMVDTKYGCIPIVDKDNVLCGIITQVDVLKLAAQILRQ